MKKYTLLSLLLLLSSYGFSQCAFTISANSPIYCNPINAGIISVNATGGIAPFSYQLSNGTPQASNIFTNVLAGTYTVYVTDATPCTDSVIVTSTQSPSAPININIITPPSCVPGCDGMATTIIIGGVPAFTYAISGGATIDTNGTAGNLCIGTTYTITVTDANTCTSSTFLQVYNPSGPTLTLASTTNPSCVPGCDGTATTTTTGGVPIYTYTVSGGAAIAANGTASNLCANSIYTISCADANSCVGVTTVLLQATNLMFLPTLLTPNGNCGYDGTFIVQGGIPPYTFNFQPGNFNNATGQFPNMQPGITYTITVIDANACSVSTTCLINPIPVLSLNAISVINVSCNNGLCDGQAEFTVAGGLAPYSFNIIGPGAPAGTFFPQLNMYYATGFCVGNYSVVITDSLGCTDTSSFVITQPPALVIDSVVTTNVLCNGNCSGTVYIYANGGTPPLNYALTPGLGQQAGPLFGVLCAGVYTVSVTDMNGCFTYSLAFINSPPLLSFSATGFTNPTCLGITDGTIGVAATGGTPTYTYTLFPGNVANVNGLFTNLTSGVYTVIATDAYSCTVSATFVLSPAGLNFSLNILSNLSCTCIGSVEVINILGGAGPFSYAISPFANQPLPGTFDNMCGGIYTITVTDINNCSGSSTINFNQIQLSSSIVNSQCNGVNNGSITCTALFGVAPYTFTLYPGNIVNQTGIFPNLVADTYTVNVVDANLCSNTLTTLVVADINNINATADLDTIICGNAGNTYFYANGGFGGGQYTYTVMPGNIVNNVGQFNALSAGNYTLNIANPAGCIKTVAFDIVQLSGLLPTTIASSVYDESCNLAGDGAIDIIPANPNGLSYLWSNNAVTQDLTNIVSGWYTVKVSDAAGNCTVVGNSVNALGVNCGSVSGNLFHDANSNCNYDAGEYAPGSLHLSLSNGAYAMTNYAGDYYFANVPYGTYTISQNITPPFAPNACVQPVSITLNAANNILNNIDFKDTMDAYTDASVQVVATQIVPGFTGVYQVLVLNNSINPVIGNLWFRLDNDIVLNSTFPANQGVYPVANADSIIWNNLNIGPNSFITLNVNFGVPAILPLGTLITSDAAFEVTNVTDYNLANNYFEHQSVSLGAYDPNDKSVNPIGEGPNGNITFQDSILNYNIRFQNTGTDSAHNIYILDTLSDKLDITTLKVTAYSHPYKIEILNGNILKFKFDNIMLPDSNINEPLSHGFIAYSIEQKNTNQIGDVINNTAAIYFDFNAPIITNTTVNTIATPALISSPEFEKTIKVYPNPATDKLTVEFNSNSYGQSSITLTNTLGQVVKTVLANAINGKNKIELSVKELPKGIYLLKLSNGKYQNMKKVAIE